MQRLRARRNCSKEPGARVKALVTSTALCPSRKDEDPANRANTSTAPSLSSTLEVRRSVTCGSELKRLVGSAGGVHAPVEAAALNTLRVPPRSLLQSLLDNPPTLLAL